MSVTLCGDDCRHYPLSRYSGAPGEGRGEGDFERPTPLVLEITLILAFSRGTGRRDQKPLATKAVTPVELPGAWRRRRP